MLTEEAHHMFVGESGVSRVVQRTAEVMAREKTDDPETLRTFGVIDLPTVQRYLNFHYSVTLDLFGADVSSNAATFYSSGIKGRYEEMKQLDDHVLDGRSYDVTESRGGALATREVPLLNALNEKLRDDYIEDTLAGVGRWNRAIARAGSTFELVVPHKAFNRRIGSLSELHVDLGGRAISKEKWDARQHEWLPTPQDREYVASLMQNVREPGKFASWIAPPAKGIKEQPVDFEYVRFA